MVHCFYFSFFFFLACESLLFLVLSSVRTVIIAIVRAEVLIAISSQAIELRALLVLRAIAGIGVFLATLVGLIMLLVISRGLWLLLVVVLFISGRLGVTILLVVRLFLVGLPLVVRLLVVVWLIPVVLCHLLLPGRLICGGCGRLGGGLVAAQATVEVVLGVAVGVGLDHPVPGAVASETRLVGLRRTDPATEPQCPGARPALGGPPAGQRVALLIVADVAGVALLRLAPHA